jgi:nucleotide-binding universal stress UspA family protein
VTIALGIVVGLLLGVLAALVLSRTRRNISARGAGRVRSILLPFTGTTISRRALDAALRLAGVEGATVVPAYLARVPLHMPLDVPLPRQAEMAFPLLEAIEQRARVQNIPIDSRIERGRSYRDALKKLLKQEHFDRVIISATADPREGFSWDDIAWLLEKAEAEVLILRPAPDDHRVVSEPGVGGHF